jgi:hypothetical protein
VPGPARLAAQSLWLTATQPLSPPADTTTTTTIHVCLCACPAAQDSVIIGARLDFEASGDSCRLSFYGRLCAALPTGSPHELQRLQVYKVGSWVDAAARCSGLVGCGLASLLTRPAGHTHMSGQGASGLHLARHARRLLCGVQGAVQKGK